jgi:hypothetical protein
VAAAEAGVDFTESVIVCINVPPEVHCSAIARVNTSTEVVIELVESRPRSLVVPVISTDCERCIRRVSPMCGRICRRTVWANAVCPSKPTARRVLRIMRQLRNRTDRFRARI